MTATTPTAWERLLLALFVDNRVLPALWHCHRLPSRSFRVRNRQFHVCARCTGLVAGVAAVPVWVSLAPIGHGLLAAGLALNLLDGGTQLLRLRESTNALRLALGVLLGAGLPAALVHHFT